MDPVSKTINRLLVHRVHIQDMELRDDGALLWAGETMIINLPLTQHTEELTVLFDQVNS